ncbi:hypothetical protein LU196_06220 [Pantoea sp. Mb-10]|uniref:type II secretion system protein N n=1 Tax=unclassified Pantoea TaxID=2630326 RepID=UPI001E2ADE6E|nr:MULTISPECIES: type II secretion system protein N [unclassified Pantoea]MCE0489646.1 hypothetical protein [Pantoea sp. Mb-10]MCE0501249.1 hypothetical protein [Pantoea sp. Pb-8]
MFKQRIEKHKIGLTYCAAAGAVGALLLFWTVAVVSQERLSAHEQALLPAPLAARKSVDKVLIPLFQENGRRSPFNLADMSPDDIRLKAAPVTRLPVTATGIVYSSKADRSLAILLSGGTQHTLKTGEKLPGTEALIAHIYPEHIIIQHKDNYESLHLTF